MSRGRQNDDISEATLRSEQTGSVGACSHFKTLETHQGTGAPPGMESAFPEFRPTGCREVTVLRILRTDCGRDVTLELRGQIVEPWTDVLRDEGEAILRQSGRLELDLRRVTLVSVRGLELIRWLVDSGARMTGSSLIEGMLEGIEPSRDRGKTR